MKVGDRVRMINPRHQTHFLKVGYITNTAALYYGEVGRKDDWMVKFEDGVELSWLETSLELFPTDYDFACQILGEDYFA